MGKVIFDVSMSPDSRPSEVRASSLCLPLGASLIYQK